MLTHRPAGKPSALIVCFLDDAEVVRCVPVAIMMKTLLDVFHVLGVSAEASII
jgi:hypothetical protein